MIKYEIKPRVKFKLFKKNELVYDLVKQETAGYYDGDDCNGGTFWNEQIYSKTLFTSPNIEEVKTIKENLEKL